jgi:Ca2+-binding EF-hand superfamily protein
MQVYQALFPLGESSKYAHLVFNSIDKQRTGELVAGMTVPTLRYRAGGITFGDFMEFLSMLSKGSERDKILWTFHFYDVNSDGCISRDEMMKVANSTTTMQCIANS